MLLVLLMLVSVLHAQDEVQVYAMGLSHHYAWTEKYPPNQHNYGSGLGYAHRLLGLDGVPVFWETAGLTYKDSYANRAYIVETGFCLRPAVGPLCGELGAGLAWVNGSGAQGVGFAGYVGSGYKTSLGTIFVEGTYNPYSHVAAGWLKLAIPLR